MRSGLACGRCARGLREGARPTRVDRAAVHVFLRVCFAPVSHERLTGGARRLCRTCLHLAASVGNLAFVDLILKHGAKVNAKDRWGGTPLRDAVREGHLSVARALRAAGGTLNYDQLQSSGELCEVVRSGDFERLKVLIECGCDVNAAGTLRSPRPVPARARSARHHV